MLKQIKYTQIHYTIHSVHIFPPENFPQKCFKKNVKNKIPNLEVT